MLREEGFDVTAYECGDNARDIHDRKALSKKYDVVYASNVLNVQSNEKMIRDTIKQIYFAVKKGGCAIVNYPKTPRKNNLTIEDVENILREYFNVKEHKERNYSGKIWILFKN